MIAYQEVVQLELNINDEYRKVTVRTADTLLQVLREQLGLTGAKVGCENGDCGTCTVLVDGLPIKACIMLAVEAVGHKITTVEGLKDSPIQKAFLEKMGFQCGFCTPGFIINCYALTKLHPKPSDEVIEKWLESNICRCTGYEEIKEAVKQVLAEK